MEFVRCSHCSYVMRPLNGFENLTRKEVPSVEMGDLIDYWFWEWLMAIVDVVRNLLRFGSYFYRKWKVKRLSKTLIPQYPNSLICPECLFVIKR